MNKKAKDQQYAKIAIDNYFIQNKQALECLRIQQKLEEQGKPVPPIDQILVQKGYLTAVQKDVVHRMVSASDLQGEVVSDSSDKKQQAKKKVKKKEKSASPDQKTNLADHPEVNPPKTETQITERIVPSFKKRTLAGYELLELLGKGAMGMVCKARQISMDRLVAVKILAPELAKNEEFRQRFLQEARATAKLNHNNIVAGIDVGEFKGEYYFVMEYVDGFTLLKRLERGGAEEEKQALNIVLQMARALEHAHKNKMVHRDIKPDNILLTRNSVAKLCDLGLALHAQANKKEQGKSIGTPNYISPEQALGEGEIDIRSDIYSLGATFFHMLAGEPPFQGSPAVVMTKHINEEPPYLLDINESLREGTALIVDKMLDKDPDYRYQTPTELIEDLERVSEGYPPKYAGVEDDGYGAEVGDSAPKIKEVSSSGKKKKVGAGKVSGKGKAIPKPAATVKGKTVPRARGGIRSSLRKRRSRFK